MQRATDPAVQRAREVRRPPYVPRAAALRPLLLQARPRHPSSLLRSVGTNHLCVNALYGLQIVQFGAQTVLPSHPA